MLELINLFLTGILGHQIYVVGRNAIDILVVADDDGGLLTGIGGHTDGIVDYAIDLEGVDMAYFAREIDGGKVKVSLRALAPCSVDQIAAQFGGGGHKLAAGLTLNMPMEDAVRTVEAALEAAL